MQHFRQSSYRLLLQITVSLCEITEDGIIKRPAKLLFVLYNLNVSFWNFYFPLKTDFGKLKKFSIGFYSPWRKINFICTLFHSSKKLLNSVIQRMAYPVSYSSGISLLPFFLPICICFVSNYFKSIEHTHSHPN